MYDIVHLLYYLKVSFLYKSLTKLLQEIEVSECIFQDTISPDKNPELFIDLSTTDGGSTRIPDCTYRDKLMTIISPTYKPHRFKWVTPPDYEPCLLELLTNAFERGKQSVQRKSGGFKTSERKPYKISYEGEGNIVNMQILKGQ